MRKNPRMSDEYVKGTMVPKHDLTVAALFEAPPQFHDSRLKFKHVPVRRQM
jgi:hypothetical protein